MMNEICRNPEPIAWDTYIHTRPEACFSHLWGWSEVLASTYDLPVFRLALKREGRVAGILPLVLFSAPGQERRLVSLPYTDAAGLVADDAHAAADLLVAAWEMTVDPGVQHLELRQAGEGTLSLSAGDETIAHRRHSFKTGLARDLPVSSEELWEALDSKVRNQVRKARKCGCRAEVGGAELLPDFYRVFSENMRDLGSPVHDPRLFQDMILQVASRVVVVFIEDTAAAAAIVFRKGTTLYNPWASSLKRFRPQCPNMMLYWSMLAFAADNGCERFDFGRSTPDAPTCRFKLQWGARMEPLVWHVFSRRGSDWNPRRESLVDAEWKRLDLAESRKRGPSVRRWISL
jgi:FemAB-related protein (PEP-CTERM system-associated)